MTPNLLTGRATTLMYALLQPPNDRPQWFTQLRAYIIQRAAPDPAITLPQYKAALDTVADVERELLP